MKWPRCIRGMSCPPMSDAYANTDLWLCACFAWLSERGACVERVVGTTHPRAHLCTDERRWSAPQPAPATLRSTARNSTGLSELPFNNTCFGSFMLYLYWILSKKGQTVCLSRIALRWDMGKGERSGKCPCLEPRTKTLKFIAHTFIWHYRWL